MLHLCINQQQQQQQQQALLHLQQQPALGTSGYSMWASSVGSRLLPFKLWAPASASAASAGDVSAPSASANASANGIPAEGDGTGAAAPSTAAAGSCSASVRATAVASASAAGSDVGKALGASEAGVGTSSATTQATAVTYATATVTMDDATVGPLSVEIKLRSGATPGELLLRLHHVMLLVICHPSHSVCYAPSVLLHQAVDVCMVRKAEALCMFGNGIRC